MRNSRLGHYLSLLILFLGASAFNTIKAQDRAVPTLHIDPDSKEISCRLSEVVSDVKVIRLETNENCLIDYFSELVYIDTQHIIYRSKRTILIFDGTGKYLNKVDAEGKGPGEYASIKDCFFDPKEKRAYIVDYDHVKTYGIDGEFIASSKLPFSSGGVFRKPNGEMIAVCSQKYKYEDRDVLSLLGPSFEVRHTFKSKNPDVCKDVQQNLFFADPPYELNDRFFYIEPFVDTIFEIKGTTMIPHWVIDMGGRGYETRDGINISNQRKMALKKIAPIELRETTNCFFVDYWFNQAKYMSVYDKKQGEFIFNKKYTLKDYPDPVVPPPFGLENDLLENAPTFWPNYIDSKVAVGVVSPSHLSEGQLEAFGCDFEDNPILLVGTLK